MAGGTRQLLLAGGTRQHRARSAPLYRPISLAMPTTAANAAAASAAAMPARTSAMKSQMTRPRADRVAHHDIERPPGDASRPPSPLPPWPRLASCPLPLGRTRGAPSSASRFLRAARPHPDTCLCRDALCREQVCTWSCAHPQLALEVGAPMHAHAARPHARARAPVHAALPHARPLVFQVHGVRPVHLLWRVL